LIKHKEFDVYNSVEEDEFYESTSPEPIPILPEKRSRVLGRLDRGIKLTNLPKPPRFAKQLIQQSLPNQKLFKNKRNQNEGSDSFHFDELGRKGIGHKAPKKKTGKTLNKSVNHSTPEHISVRERKFASRMQSSSVSNRLPPPPYGKSMGHGIIKNNLKYHFASHPNPA
jgi:hypothetical protein